MGYRGKVDLQQRARELRLEGRTLKDIADELGVAKSSVSRWVRDLGIEVRRRQPGPVRRHRLQEAKLQQIEQLNTEGIARVGELSTQAFLVASAMLYAGEGDKRDGNVGLANSDPRIHQFFLAWLRRFFDIDESRLRVYLYLHDGLDLEAANEFWSRTTGIPTSQFTRPYRAVPDASIRTAKHPMGCPKVRYSCARTHRAVMGLVDALLSSTSYSGVAQSVEQGTVNAKAVGSSPTPGASGFDVDTAPEGP